MKTRKFRPVGIDALEERCVMTAFSIPFTLVTPPASQVNPKFLVLTGRTEGQINSSIASSFHQFENTVVSAFNIYNKNLSRTSVTPAANLATLQTKLNGAFNRLSSDLLKVSRMVSYGGVNLNPVLQNRITGTTGVTDTTTHINTPSLQSQLNNLVTAGTTSTSQVKSAIGGTQSLVSTDVNNYINLGVTNGFFRLDRGAKLPALR
jgi:hypothetical protein